MIIHTIELQLSPHPPHPPQFVAAKSLINNPPIKHLQYNNMNAGLLVLLIFFEILQYL